MKYLVFPLFILLFFASCATQEVCNDDNNSYLVVRFKTLEDESIQDTALTDMSIYGIREGREDSLLYNSFTMSKAQLPLDPNKDFSHFVLSNGLRSDTLLLSHSSEVYLINYSCGFASRFTMEDYRPSGNWMIDMDLRNANIDAELEQDEEHLWIYF